jgi:hypothetical protein
MGYYDVAQICLNGHVVNDSYNVFPEENQDFCHSCGAETIKKCLNCNKKIKGRYIPSHDDVVIIPGGEYEIRSYCDCCGKPYPWTEEKIKAAKELTSELEYLSEEEKETLQNSIEYIVSDNPRTQLEATKFKRIMSNVGSETYGIFRDILVDVLSSTAKKIIYGE